METLGTSQAEIAREFNPAIHNRRRRVRQKVHTPAYAHLRHVSGDRDLSEILNISEDGIAVQTSSPVSTGSSLSLALDLSETRVNIWTAGRVVWSDNSGRAGIHFPEMADESRRQLKEWLFVNAISACANHDSALLPEPVAERVDGPRSGDLDWQSGKRPGELQTAVPPDYTAMLAALAAVAREVHNLGNDLDAGLQLIVRRALTFTDAGGAAIALSEGEDMMCRASFGRDAPGLGARLKSGSGFSGECVRTAQLLRCEDSETNELVDHQSCRDLGIRSMIAVPIFWEQSVIGLLEVFSPYPSAFAASHDKILERLSEVASSAVYRAGAPARLSETASSSLDDEFPVEAPIQAALIKPLSRPRKVLFAAVAATLIAAMVWLIVPGDGGRGVPAIRPSSTSASPKSLTTASAQTTNLQDLRRVAEQGDPAAQFAVGARYATGEDVPQDYSEAVRWFAMAADQGHVVSQATLGAYYWAGRGVPQDLVKAYFWSVLAQTGGDEASKYRVAVLASRMTRGQIVAAQQQANDWIKQHQLASRNTPLVQ